jgi:hypothetical protein
MRLHLRHKWQAVPIAEGADVDVPRVRRRNMGSVSTPNPDGIFMFDVLWFLFHVSASEEKVSVSLAIMRVDG